MSEALIQQIRNKERVIKDLEHVQSLLAWDQETGMPVSASEGRGRQMGMIQSLLTEHLQDSCWDEWIPFLEEQGNSELKQWGSLLNKRYMEFKVLPSDFMTRFVEAANTARTHWLQARDKNDFAHFAPSLNTLVNLQKERISYHPSQKEPYDILLDQYEPGMKASVLEPLFDQLQADLQPLLHQAEEKQRKVSLFKDLRIPKDIQETLSLRVLQDMGYDFKAGRLDSSVHPFTTTLGERDVRVTTAYKDNDFFSGLSSTIHEGGHGLYEQNLPSTWSGTLIAEACSLGFHESQSRFWENIVGRSRAFCHYLKRLFSEYAPHIDINEDDLFHELNRVERGLIRVDADEFTYNLHIILRFRLERELLNGNIETKDLGALWNEESRKLIGISSDDDLHGVLQDIHWCGGDMGYFPTYSLGNLYSAQIWSAMQNDLPSCLIDIEKGDFLKIKEWLRTHVHEKGSLFSSVDLMKQISSEKPDSRFFTEYLKERQKELYA